MATTIHHSEYIFVFGSNARGAHGLGAAKTAEQHYGAVTGQGEGLQGRSYGIPTKDEKIRSLTLTEVRDGVNRFLSFAASEPDTEFMVTRIGCGLAGFHDSDVAPLFSKVTDNVSLPRAWQALLGATDFHLLVSGATSMRNEQLLTNKLDLWLRDKTEVPITLHIDERDKGPGALAAAYAEDRGYNVTRWPADWRVFSRHAGYLRNHAMLWNADACALFSADNDTDSQIITKACRQQGVPLRHVVEG